MLSLPSDSQNLPNMPKTRSSTRMTAAQPEAKRSRVENGESNPELLDILQSLVSLPKIVQDLKK